jgi:hypothetical protein
MPRAASVENERCIVVLEWDRLVGAHNVTLAYGQRKNAPDPVVASGGGCQSNRSMDTNRAGRLGITALLAIYGFRMLVHPDAGSLMDSVDLPIHETGHLVFAAFGEVMQFLGGTLFQLIVPAVFAGYFFVKRRDAHAGFTCLWWVAQNFWNISVYVADARSELLPLVGGGEHDWAFLLGRFGWLNKDHVIAHNVWVVGVMLYVVAIGGALLAASNAPAVTESELVATEAQ